MPKSAGQSKKILYSISDERVAEPGMSENGKTRRQMSAKTEQKVVHILQAISDGQGNLVELCKDLRLNYFSTKNLLKDTYDQTGAENLPHLIAIYFRRGLLR